MVGVGVVWRILPEQTKQRKRVRDMKINEKQVGSSESYVQRSTTTRVSILGIKSATLSVPNSRTGWFPLFPVGSDGFGIIIQRRSNLSSGAVVLEDVVALIVAPGRGVVFVALVDAVSAMTSLLRPRTGVYSDTNPWVGFGARAVANRYFSFIVVQAGEACG